MKALHNVALFNCYYCNVNKGLAFSFLRDFTREEHSMGWTIMAQSTTAITSAINSITVYFPFPKFNDKLDGVSNDGTGVPEKKTVSPHRNHVAQRIPVISTRGVTSAL